MMSSSEADIPRGGFAHIEHRRPDTPRGKDDDEASSQPLVRTGGEGAHDNIKSTGCGSSCDLRAGERLPKQRPLGDEHPESGQEEHLYNSAEARACPGSKAKKSKRPRMMQQRRKTKVLTKTQKS